MVRSPDTFPPFSFILNIIAHLLWSQLPTLIAPLSLLPDNLRHILQEIQNSFKNK